MITQKVARGSRTALLLLAGAVVAAVPAVPAVLGQVATPAVKSPAFDVVTIKPNNSGSRGGAWGVSQNKYSARNTPLSRIILQAYLGQMAVSEDRLKNAPDWVITDPYDITANDARGYGRFTHISKSRCGAPRGLRRPVIR